MVLALVLLPAIAAANSAGGTGSGSVVWPLVTTVLKVAGFVALMLIVGRRVIPWLLHWVVHTGSRELFRLAVLAIALGVAAGAAFIFDVSFALGAFFAGMILGETQLSRRAAEETLPLRDAFAVLFFVAVGMLFDPAVLIEQPLPLIATVLIIVVGKSVAAYGIVRAFGYPAHTSVTISASLAQIGEFSFILAGLGTSLDVLPPEGRDLILAGAILSILANPVIFSIVAGRGQSARAEAAAQFKADEEDKQRRREEHVILVGYGRVGRIIASEMSERGRAIVIVEDQPDVARRARDDGFQVVIGNATQETILQTAGIEHAAKLLIAIPEGFEGGVVAERARAMSAELPIIARAHSDAEVEFLSRLGANHVVMGERETAAKMYQLSLEAAGNAPSPSTA